MNIYSKFKAKDKKLLKLKSGGAIVKEEQKLVKEKQKSRQTLILLVDDDELFLTIVRSVMEEEGFFVVTAASGEEAVTMAKKVNPDLIIMDSNMPILSGEQACKLLKNEHKTKEIPIIILSGLEDEVSIRKFIASGCDDYFPKSKLINNLSSTLKDKVYKALKSL